jgi:hypothetical protein
VFGKPGLIRLDEFRVARQGRVAAIASGLRWRSLSPGPYREVRATKRPTEMVFSPSTWWITSAWPTRPHAVRTSPGPPRRIPCHREQWCAIRDRLHEQVNATLEARQKVLHNMSDLRRYGIDWDSNPA